MAIVILSTPEHLVAQLSLLRNSFCMGFSFVFYCSLLHMCALSSLTYGCPGKWPQTCFSPLCLLYLILSGPITGIRDFVIKLYLDSRCNYLMLDGLGLQDFISTEIRNGTPLFYTLQICFFNVLLFFASYVCIIVSYLWFVLENDLRLVFHLYVCCIWYWVTCLE
jgi:hypothetical protein